jgi:uncharacterized phiE125 gp8 family phage protein
VSLTLVTAPTVEPLQLADAKAHLRVDASHEDALIQRLIVAARRAAETATGRALCTQSWQWTADRWPCRAPITLPKAPVQSVTHVKYVATDGTLTTWSSAEWQADLTSELPRILPAYGYTWPSLRDQMAAVRVEFVAGYGAAAAVPEDIKAAMLLIVGHLFEHREDVADFQVFQVPRAADWLLGPHKLHFA